MGRGPEDSQGNGVRALEILFTPWNTGHTTVNVLTVDYRGDRRVARRIGSCSLRVGRVDLVGITPGEVTRLLLNLLQTALSEEDARAAGTVNGGPIGRQAPAPPEGATGAAWNRLENIPIPGL